MQKPKEETKKVVYIIIFSIFIILLISTASAGILDWIKKITGKTVDKPLEINISVGVPQITNVYNESIDLSSGPTQAESNTNITINFTVYCPSEFTNINHSSAKVNVSSSGETTRENSTCAWLADFATYYANFTCQIELWWWDGAGTWDITAYIEDNNTNVGQNTTTSFVIGTRTGFEMAPGNLTWGAIGAGAVNQTASNDPLLLNNTGNDVIDAQNIKINATNLRGESDSTKALWAGNFSVGYVSTGSNEECDDATSNTTVAGNFQGLDIANLTKGNYTQNDNVSGQEQLYFCLRLAGSELITQAYSTLNESAWTVQIGP